MVGGSNIGPSYKSVRNCLCLLIGLSYKTVKELSVSIDDIYQLIISEMSRDPTILIVT